MTLHTIQQTLVKLKAQQADLSINCPSSIDDKYMDESGKYNNTQFHLDVDAFHYKMDCLYAAVKRYEEDVLISHALNLIKE